MHPQHHPFYHLKWGIFFILLAWLAFTLMATLSRIATATVPLSSVLVFQNFVSWLAIVPWVFIHRIHSLRTERFGLIFVRSFLGTVGFALLFLAVERTSLVDAVLLNNAAPLLVPFVVWIWLKKPINHKLWPGIIAGFIGIIFILKPGKALLDPGALFALASACCMALAMISVRLLSYTERSHVVLFYYFLIGSLITLPFSLYFWKPLYGIEWLELILIGCFSVLGQWCFMRAFHHAKPTHLGPFCYMAVVYSGIIEWILWGKVPDLFAWMGILLVVMGGIWTIRHSEPPPPKAV